MKVQIEYSRVSTSRLEAMLDIRQPYSGPGIHKHEVIVTQSFTQSNECFSNSYIHWHSAILSCLCLLHIDDVKSEVDVASVQLQQLTTTHSGVDCQSNQRLQVRSSARKGSHQPVLFCRA